MASKSFVGKVAMVKEKENSKMRWRYWEEQAAIVFVTVDARVESGGHSHKLAKGTRVRAEKVWRQ